MIQSTTTDLADHLYDIDNKLRESDQERDASEDTVDGRAILAERASIVQCLQICGQVSHSIEERQQRMADKAVGPKASDTDAGSGDGGEPSFAQQVMHHSLQGCKFNIKSANAQLSTRLQYLSTSLSDAPPDVLQASTDRQKDREEMIKDIEGVRRCLDICTQATDEAEKARTNIMEDITTAEDSRQVLVSTVGDLIAAHRVTAGARSLQAIGQMTDETLQHLSRMPGLPPAIPAQSADGSRQERHSHPNSGRTLGSSNVRTL